jgi:nitrate reductase NapAB chaperone NapD
MIITAVVTAKAGESREVTAFLQKFKEVSVHSVKDNEILIIIDAEMERIEEFSKQTLDNGGVMSLLHHSYHFV